MNRPIRDVLFGTAVGDSLGLPAENLPPWKIQKRWNGTWSQRLFFGRGMVSDDTEHTVFVAQCLDEKPSSPESFQRKLAWKLRLWLLCLPTGIGFATSRATLKLWLGFRCNQPPEIRGSGYVVKSLEAALWAFHLSDDFRTECLLAVNLGHDADTTGAVYGQIAGARN